ncbi:hypothetical protein AFLA_005814 [Aspergillus flavus NRRL3357]|nr:hypothetical protein AFLA_005814 [Aspergillus flavus NRRL3357]
MTPEHNYVMHGLWSKILAKFMWHVMCSHQVNAVAEFILSEGFRTPHDISRSIVVLKSWIWAHNGPGYWG